MHSFSSLALMPFAACMHRPAPHRTPSGPRVKEFEARLGSFITLHMWLGRGVSRCAPCSRPRSKRT